VIRTNVEWIRPKPEVVIVHMFVSAPCLALVLHHLWFLCAAYKCTYLLKCYSTLALNCDLLSPKFNAFISVQYYIIGVSLVKVRLIFFKTSWKWTAVISFICPALILQWLLCGESQTPDCRWYNSPMRAKTLFLE